MGGPLSHSEKVPHRKGFQYVVQEIENAIIDGKFHNGEYLPPERKLKELFKVSRNTLREALKVLEDRGLIQIKLGAHGGAIVKQVSTQKVSEALSLLFRSQSVSMMHLVEFRQAIEGEIALLAALRATQAEIDTLRSISKEAIGKIDNKKSFLEIDKKFHIELSKISKNPVYILVAKTVHTNIDNYYDEYIELIGKDELMDSYHYFCRLIAAIDEKQVAEAKILAQNHVLKHIQRRAEVGSRDQINLNRNVARAPDPDKPE